MSSYNIGINAVEDIILKLLAKIAPMHSSIDGMQAGRSCGIDIEPDLSEVAIHLYTYIYTYAYEYIYIYV